MSNKILILVIDTGGQASQEIHPGNAKIEEKGAYVRVRSAEDNSILAFYPTARVIAGRYINTDDLKTKAPDGPVQDETVHQGDRVEEQSDSPDR